MADIQSRGVDSATNILARLLTEEKLGTNRIVCALDKLTDAIEEGSSTNNPETDVLYTTWLPFCQAGYQWYEAERFSVNNSTGTTTSLGRVYKQTATGNITTAAPPMTDRQDGLCRSSCPTCRSNIVPTPPSPTVTTVNDTVPISSATPQTINVSTNDTSNAECAPITYSVVGTPVNATVTNTGSTFNISPIGEGPYSFRYRACCADGTTCSESDVTGEWERVAPEVITPEISALRCGRVYGNTNTGKLIEFNLDPAGNVTSEVEVCANMVHPDTGQPFVALDLAISSDGKFYANVFAGPDGSTEVLEINPDTCVVSHLSPQRVVAGGSGLAYYRDNKLFSTAAVDPTGANTRGIYLDSLTTGVRELWADMGAAYPASGANGRGVSGDYIVIDNWLYIAMTSASSPDRDLVALGIAPDGSWNGIIEERGILPNTPSTSTGLYFGLATAGGRLYGLNGQDVVLIDTANASNSSTVYTSTTPNVGTFFGAASIEDGDVECS